MASTFPKLTNLWTNQLRCFHLSALLSQIRILKRPVCTANDYNPFLNQEFLPRFKEIQPSHVVPAIEKLTHEFQNDFMEFEKKLKGKLKELLGKLLVHLISSYCLSCLVTSLTIQETYFK